MSRIDTTIRTCKTFEEFQQLVRSLWERLAVIVNNLPQPVLIGVTTPPVPDTDFGVSHFLGYVPSRYIVLSKTAPCDVYKGSVDATDEGITLRATASGVDLLLEIR